MFDLEYSVCDEAAICFTIGISNIGGHGSLSYLQGLFWK